MIIKESVKNTKENNSTHKELTPASIRELSTQSSKVELTKVKERLNKQR